MVDDEHVVLVIGMILLIVGQSYRSRFLQVVGTILLFLGLAGTRLF